MAKAESLKEFYPYYLKEHSSPVNRVLHLIGTSIGITLVIYALAIGPWWLLFLAFLPGYAFAWVGHFIVEKNRPATFTHPIYSFICDFWMFFDLLSGRRSLWEFRNKESE